LSDPFFSADAICYFRHDARVNDDDALPDMRAFYGASAKRACYFDADSDVIRTMPMLRVDTFIFCHARFSDDELRADTAFD